MDRTAFIEQNHASLTRIVAALIAMVGLADGGVAARLPRVLYRAVGRVLGPAESAVRRLIVIVARGLTVKLPSVRPMPNGLVRGRAGNGRLAFRLFDARNRFSSPRRKIAARAEPRIHFFAVSPLVPMFQSGPVDTRVAVSVPAPDGEVDARSIGRRLAAIKMALENLPHQAKRLVRWQARRERSQRPTFRSPLRPGPPPGHRNESEEEIERVLVRCHTLAWETLNENTS
ncbi:hypothetical protein BH10PSE7_BH10PSE7_04660 [soil metagenome]